MRTRRTGSQKAPTRPATLAGQISITSGNKTVDDEPRQHAITRRECRCKHESLIKLFTVCKQSAHTIKRTQLCAEKKITGNWTKTSAECAVTLMVKMCNHKWSGRELFYIHVC